MNIARRNTFFVIFALSGFSGLIYESIWTHYLKLFLGHAAYAQTLVLAIFMGGLALGSWICSRYSGRWKNLLLGYALAEGLIGLCAIVFHDVFDQTTRISYAAVIPYLETPLAVNAFKWTISSLLIFPQSILLGMTFPLMSAGIIRAFPKEPGSTVSMLYFTNSIGAAVGVLVSGFVLIGLIGLPGTIRIAGIINVALAAYVWLVTRGQALESRSFEMQADSPQASQDGRWYLIMLLASLVTGTASFIYEIGWIRMLSLVLGSSTHAFELMLSAFILGLAFGGLWIKRRIDILANPVRFLLKVQVVMGLLALSTLPLYGNTFYLMRWVLSTVSRTDIGYTMFNLSSSAIAVAVMLPTTFCAGMTLPLITYTLIRRGYGERSIGAVYAANTVGAIVGVFFAIHIGMPLLGLKGLITLGGTLDIGLGVALLWSTLAGTSTIRRQAAVTALCVSAIAATLGFVELDPYKMASGVYRGSGQLLDRERIKIIYHKDGKTATVSVSQSNDPNQIMSIRTNGKPDAALNMNPYGASGKDEPTMILAGAIPLLLHPQARTAANIGLGSGLTTQTLLGSPTLESVDTVEIERAMVEAARNFGPRVESVYNDPRSKIYIEDAKTFFSAHNKKYDLIVSEPSNPWVSGVAGLFSEEFYQLINRYLNEDGLFVQWIQLYETNIDLVVSVLKAISSNFSDFVLFAPNDVDLLIVAKRSGTIGDLKPDLLGAERVARGLNWSYMRNLQDIEIRKIGNKKLLARVLDTFPIRANSDYYPVLDQNAVRARFLQTTAQELIIFAQEPLPVAEMLTASRMLRIATDVTPISYYPKTLWAFTAMSLRDYYLQGSFDKKYGQIATDTKQDALQLRCLFEKCGFVLSEEERIMSLFNTATVLVPYLTPEESDAVWRKLESGKDRPPLTAVEKQWITLFKALGRRDAGGTAAAAKTLLENGKALTPDRLRYVVAAAMLGDLSGGNKEGAFRLWSAYGPQLLKEGSPGLLLRVLAANSER